MLTPTEKIAGRAFRARAQDALTATHQTNPPTHVVPNLLANFRHLCPKRHNISTAMELKEVYVFSPAYLVQGETAQEIAVNDLPAELSGQSMEHTLFTVVSARRFGFIYKEGACRGCGQTARSDIGRIVDARERPPLARRGA